MIWKEMTDGWTKRYNDLINCINNHLDVDKVKNEFEPPMDDEEIEWYVRSLKKLDEENEKIRKQCEKIGIPVYRTGYGTVENEY